MAHEHDPDLEEALRRSLQQTNLQESQLADALAESVRTHDHEMARDMQRDQLTQIEQDLMNQTTSRQENLARYLEAELLSSPSSSHTDEGEWKVVGDRTARRPRYVPLNVRKRSVNTAHHNPVEAENNSNTSEEYNRASATGSRSTVYRTSHSRQRIPYRPPNLHRSHNSTPSMSDPGSRITTSNSVNDAVNKSPSVSIAPIPQYRPPTGHQSRIRQYSGAVTGTTSEPLVVIDGQNVGCSYGAGGVSRFRAKGVEVVLDFYFNQGIPAVAVLPRHKVDTRSNIVNDRVADDPDLLKKLEDQGRLAFTPAGAHDDHFLLSYALNKDIDLISNDRFQKEIAEQETHTDARKLRDFLDEHLIPYTFIHGEFVPNPKQSQLGRAVHHSRTRN